MKNHVIINERGFLILIENEKKTFRVIIITIILCNPCNMPKYVPRLEGIMPSKLGTYFGILHRNHDIIVLVIYMLSPK